MKNMAVGIRNSLKFSEFVGGDGCSNTVGFLWKGELVRSTLAT